MALFDWDNKYSVGVYSMDSHHKKLFDIINKLNDAMKEGKGEEAAGRTIKELLDYTHYHFGEEEKLLEQIGYSGLESQKRAHRMFTDKLEEYMKEADAGLAIFVSSKVVNTAIDWLKEHIMRMDTQYTKEMNSAGMR